VISDVGENGHSHWILAKPLRVGRCACAGADNALTANMKRPARPAVFDACSDPDLRVSSYMNALSNGRKVVSLDIIARWRHSLSDRFPFLRISDGNKPIALMQRVARVLK
jgi:hypothetical protein